MIGPCVIPYGTGVDYMAAMIQNSVGDEVDLSVGEHTAVATKILAFDNGIVKHLPNVDALGTEYGVEIYHHMSENMIVNEYHTNLDGCGYVISKGNTIEEAEKKASKVLEIIKAESF